MKIRISIPLLLLILLVFSTEGGASTITEVVSTSPSWATFTNKDGTGLYHEILREVFALYNIPVQHLYSKSGRAEELLMSNQADMMTCDDKATEPLALARYPMYVNDYFVFFKKDRIGPWNGIETLRDKEVLSQPTYYNQENFPVPVQIKDIATGEQAAGLIIMNRSDFYVDDLLLINQSLEGSDQIYNKDDYAIEKVGRRSYHPLFNTTKRGNTIRKMYEDGMIKLHQEGKLKPIYDKWGYKYPDFQSY